MIKVLPVTLTIAAAGTSHVSAAVLLSPSQYLVGWEFTTPDYDTARTSIVSILSPTGRTLLTGSAVNEATESVKICTEAEQVPLMSGFQVHVTTAGAVGVAATFTILLYVEDLVIGSINVPQSFINVMSFGLHDATLSQATPVQNTWYKILDTVYNAKLFGIAVAVADTGEDLEVRVTVDGTVLTGTQSAVAGTAYKALPYTAPTGTYLLMSTSSLINGNELEGRSLKVEVRKTSAAGTGTITGAVSYSTRG